MKPATVKLIIGLGNPDKKYRHTYHNIGQEFIDFLSAHSRGNISLKKTDIYMNQSGLFVKKQLAGKRVRPEELLVVHDDSDILVGNYKLSFGRGSAGHKGAQNIISQLKTKKFWRLRIGIRPQRNSAKAETLVLKKISSSNKKRLAAVFEAICRDKRFTALLPSINNLINF